MTAACVVFDPVLLFGPVAGCEYAGREFPKLVKISKNPTKAKIRRM
jgi:hypothetical protein